MTYFNQPTDLILKSQLELLLPKQYCKQTEIVSINVSPQTPVHTKAIKVEAPTCFPSDIDSDVAGIFMFDKVLVPNASMSGEVKAIIFKTPDPDVIDKICRMYLYLYMGDSPSTLSMITEISNETKNVIFENNASMRRQPMQNVELVPWQL